MEQAMTKDEILDALEDERENLLDAIEGLSDEVMLEAGVVGDWSIKDILAHLSAWEAELVKLLWQASHGERPSGIYASGVPVDEVNTVWSQAARSRPLDRVIDDFISVRKQTIRRVEPFSDADLSDPQRYPWLKGNPLWEWIGSDSFKHESEHAAQIREWRANRGI
jgi:hypothetical protein